MWNKYHRLTKKYRLIAKQRFLLFAILCLTLLLIGCNNNKQVTLLPYDSMTSLDLVRVDYLKSDEPYKASRFSEELCVIPIDYKQEKDRELKASSIIRMDLTDQTVIYADAPFKKLYPASITKIVTALVVLKHGNLEDEVKVSYNAANIREVGAKKCGLKTGDRIKMEALLNSFLIYSGNDAGIAIAEHVAGSVKEFAKMMNEEAKALGATGSHFVNPHGLHDDKHYSTAYDIYLIMNELRKYEEFIEIVGKESYQAVYKDDKGNEVKKMFESTNWYLTGQAKPPKGVTIIGGKTGTTTKAGSCLALLTKNEDEHEYLSIILKANSGTLFNQMTHLIEQ